MSPAASRSFAAGCFSALIWLLSCGEGEAGQQVIAILKPEARFADPAFAVSFHHQLRNFFSADQRYDVLEEPELALMEEAFAAGRTGLCEDNECLFAKGRFLGSDLLFFSSLRQAKDGKVEFAFRMLDCAERTVLYAQLGTYEAKPDQLVELVKVRNDNKYPLTDLQFDPSSNMPRYAYTAKLPPPPLTNRPAYWITLVGVAFLGIAALSYLLGP